MACGASSAEVGFCLFTGLVAIVTWGIVQFGRCRGVSSAAPRSPRAPCRVAQEVSPVRVIPDFPVPLAKRR